MSTCEKSMQEGYVIYMKKLILDCIEKNERLQELAAILKGQAQNEKVDRTVVKVYAYEVLLASQRYKFYGSKVLGLSLAEGKYTNARLKDVYSFIFLALDVVDEKLKFFVGPSLIHETINLMRNLSEFQVKDTGFNPVRNYINCENGVVEINKEQIILHPRDMNIIREGRFNYMLRAKLLANTTDELDKLFDYMPNFNYFCRTSFGEDNWEIRREQLLEIMGYCLSDYEAVKKAFFLIGAPNSGKSILLQVLARFLGEKAEVEGLLTAVPLHNFTDKFALADVCLAKMNLHGEMSLSPLRDISKFKQVIGGDYIMVEKKGKDPETVKTKVKLVFAANGLAGTADLDPTKAMYHRVHLIHFPHSIEKRDQIANLADKIWKERDSIFTASMLMLQKVVKRNFVFTVHDDDQKYLDNWHLTSNSFARFYNECVYQPQNGRGIFSTTLHQHYTNYCKRNGLEEMPWRDCQIILNGLGFTTEKIRIGNKALQGYKKLAYSEHAPCQMLSDKKYYEVFDETGDDLQAAEAAEEVYQRCLNRGYSE